MAIWDNRSAYRESSVGRKFCTISSSYNVPLPNFSDAATYDLGDDVRTGTRSVSIGEKPYFDPNSKSRREALEGQ